MPRTLPLTQTQATLLHMLLHDFRTVPHDAVEEDAADAMLAALDGSYKRVSDDGRVVVLQVTADGVTVACASCGEPYRYTLTATDREDYATPEAFAEYCLENAAENTAKGGEDAHRCPLKTTHETKRRSYQIPEAGDSHTGGKGLVRTGETTTLPDGRRVRVLTYMNAGFEGITAYVVDLDTGEKTTVSAGHLTPLR